MNLVANGEGKSVRVMASPRAKGNLVVLSPVG